MESTKAMANTARITMMTTVASHCIETRYRGPHRLSAGELGRRHAGVVHADDGGPITREARALLKKAQGELLRRNETPLSRARHPEGRIPR